MPLKREQLHILHVADKTGKRPPNEVIAKVPGFHFCGDWDGLPICNDSPEIAGCTCRLAEGYGEKDDK